ncbi:hypothetical protein BT63DRAFT_452923 [Microthyrium microscopicum]|uniref:Extracellular membrane protein CFEM domain-containing protein n=1 Tax=Microthyrium microscopicum TaxID=703497 RepID=A0A6A6ULT5_9PEZI|nr:hypothetical protein BT63DRAFT_452923 [Microthyrium microscopicum]
MQYFAVLTIAFAALVAASPAPQMNMDPIVMTCAAACQAEGFMCTQGMDPKSIECKNRSKALTTRKQQCACKTS